MTAHCATCSCSVGEDIPQPSRSNDRHRAAVIAGAKQQVIDSKKRARDDVLSAAGRRTRAGDEEGTGK